MIRNSIRIVLLALLCSVLAATAAHALTLIVLDGEFADWAGKAHLDDPIDAHHDTFDIARLFWANNPDEERMYFMIERYPPGNPAMQRREVYYCLFIDVNNNGRFDDPQDGSVYINYEPYHPGEHGRVEVVSYQGDQPVAFYSGFWGEHSSSGGQRCEFYVEFTDFNIHVGQVIRMVLFATDKQRYAPDGAHFPASFEDWEAYVEKGWADRLPDAGDIQWAPVPVSTWWMHVAMIGLASACLARLYRRKRPLR